MAAQVVVFETCSEFGSWPAKHGSCSVFVVLLRAWNEAQLERVSLVDVGSFALWSKLLAVRFAPLVGHGG